jgi:DNA-binding transcriptional LysR family regulator
MNNLDLAALRTFALAADLGGFGKAAHKLHRTPGAVSLQLKALEERVATPLFERRGRQHQLTASGEVLLAYARRLLQLNDEALLALAGSTESGEIRFGMTQDFADGWLPHTLAQFARSAPAIRIQLRVGGSGELAQAFSKGDLDLALMFGPPEERSRSRAARLGVSWFASQSLKWAPDEPVPLLVLAEPCIFRDAAIRALDAAKRPWRIILVSNGVSAIWAAAEAGLGVAARTTIHVPRSLVKVKGLPQLPDVGLFLRHADGRQNSAVAHLRDLLLQTIEIKNT